MVETLLAKNSAPMCDPFGPIPIPDDSDTGTGGDTGTRTLDPLLAKQVL